MYLPSAASVSAWLIVCLSVLYTPVSPALESLGFLDLNKRVEQLEKKDAYNLSSMELSKKIEELSEDVESYASENPTNVDIIILAVRLGVLDEYFVKSKNENSKGVLVGPEDKFLSLHQRLDKAIELYPEFSAAYYWKSSLYAMTSTVSDANGQMNQRPINLQKAIQFAEKAVELDKSNSGYRQALAIYHVSAGNRKAALELLKSSDTQNSPITLLLEDMENFPIPDNAVFSQEDTDSYIELLVKKNSLENYPTLRAQVYVVPMSVEELTNFYRSKWPDFQFFARERSDLFSQYMLLHATGLRPSAHMGEAKAWASQKLGGIILSGQEIRNATDAQRLKTPAGHKLPFKWSNNYCFLFYVNDRVVQ